MLWFEPKFIFYQSQKLVSSYKHVSKLFERLILSWIKFQIITGHVTFKSCYNCSKSNWKQPLVSVVCDPEWKSCHFVTMIIFAERKHSNDYYCLSLTQDSLSGSRIASKFDRKIGPKISEKTHIRFKWKCVNVIKGISGSFFWTLFKVI